MNNAYPENTLTEELNIFTYRLMNNDFPENNLNTALYGVTYNAWCYMTCISLYHLSTYLPYDKCRVISSLPHKIGYTCSQKGKTETSKSLPPTKCSVFTIFTK